MNIIDRIFKRRPKGVRIASTLNGWSAVYSQFGQNAYEAIEVQQAIRCIVNEIKKLTPQHIRTNGTDPVPIMDSSIQKVLMNPNPIMTTSEFLEKTTWLLLLNCNAFIIPIYRTWTDKETGAEKRYYEALYPIQPTQVNFLEDASGSLFVEFFFANGTQTTIPYDNIIHLRYNYSVNQYMGGNAQGQPDNAALLQTVQMADELTKGIAAAMKASYAINGILKINTILSDQSTNDAIAEMERRLQANESGFLPLDLKSEFVPLERKSEIIDQNVIEFIDEKILRTWGVPRDILRGDYSKETYEAFYSQALEPLIISMSQSYTKRVFTDRERSFGNEIKLYPKDLIFMTTQQTLDMINILAPTGAMYENEKRAVLGMRPLPELEGKRYMSLNWIEANKAAEYQIGKDATVDIVDEEKDEV